MFGGELLVPLAQSASDCADCTKPWERSVYFSMFIAFCFRLLRHPKARGVKSPPADHISDARCLRLLPRTMNFLDSHQAGGAPAKNTFVGGRQA